MICSAPRRLEGDHAAQADRAVADYCDALARTDLRRDRSVMAGPSSHLRA